MELVLNIIDSILISAEIYLLIRLKLAKDPFFHIPFFHFFIVTGIGGILSVIGYILDVRFTLVEVQAWIFKLGYVLNSFGVTLSTLGKLCIIINRYVVMRNGRLVESIWTRRVTVCCTISIITLSTAKCSPFIFCEYSYIVVENVRYVAYFDDKCVVSEKPLTSTIYFAYALISVILTAISIRDLRKLSKNAEIATRLIVLKQQRNMLIVTGVCTISHIVKAMHQMTWVIFATFKLTSWSAVIKETYIIPHYISTYSASVVMIMLSPRVRALLLCREEGSEGRNVLSRSQSRL